MATGGTPTPPPVMGPLTPLRAELLVDEAAETSDTGSVRSLAGSISEGVQGKGRRGGKKTRGSKRGKGAKREGGGAGGSKGEGSTPGTPA